MEIVVDVAADLPTVDADALRLEQVMFNLLENAVAYSNPPRKVGAAGRAARGTDGGAGER